MNKKGQEEIMGFIAIVIIVIVAGIILLGFLISRDEGIDRESKDVKRLLESVHKYTTDCSTSYNEVDVGDLLTDCYEEPQKECPNGQNVCIELNNTVKALMRSGLGTIDNTTYYEGYSYDAVEIKNVSGVISERDIMLIEEGNCQGDYRTYSLIVSSKPKIETRLKVCLNS